MREDGSERRTAAVALGSGERMVMQDGGRAATDGLCRSVSGCGRAALCLVLVQDRSSQWV